MRPDTSYGRKYWSGGSIWRTDPGVSFAVWFEYASQYTQYYDGKKTNGNWYFFRAFDLGNGNQFIQRQYWRSVDQNTLERHTENSNDDGKTWKHFSISTLKRVL